jgi:hypothetical protein
VTGVLVPEVRPCGSGAGRLRACGSFSRGRRVWLVFGILSGGSLWWPRRRLAAGATVWVLVGHLGYVGSGLVCVGGIRGVGVFVLLPKSWRCLAPACFGFTSPVVRGVVAGDSMDGGLYSGESLARRGRCR